MLAVKKPKAKCTAKATASRHWQRVQQPPEVINAERELLPPPCVSSEGDLSRVNLPVDLTRCRARVWNSGIDYGAQCLAKPHPNTDFCGSHTGLNKLRHGRYDNPLDPTVKTHFDKEHSKVKRQTKDRWYSRVHMWHLTRSDSSKNGVEDLTDQEYDIALQKVHDYLTLKKSVRDEYGLEPNKNPSSSQERNAPIAEYLVKPRRFKYFSKKIFCQELQSLQVGLLPTTASERQFESALQATNADISKSRIAHIMATSYWYAGPQCFTHRTDASKMNIEPEQAKQRPMLLDDDQGGIFSGVMCSLCDKTRRVDSSTLSLFKNDTWLSENVALREETLLNEAPVFATASDIGVKR